MRVWARKGNFTLVDLVGQVQTENVSQQPASGTLPEHVIENRPPHQEG